ncbi:hypothetical protein ACW66K_09085 [Aerococcus urinaeequi]
MSKFRNFLMIVLLSTFSISGVLLQTDEYSRFVNALIIIPSVVLFIIFIFSKKSAKHIYFSTLDIVYLLFFISSIFSILINGNLDLLLSVVKLLVFYIVLVFLPKNNNRLFSYDIYINSFSFSSIIGVALTMLMYPITLGISNYSGVFDNPNNLGVFVSAATLIFLFQLIRNILFKNIFFIVIYSILTPISLYLVSISASRTALIGLGVSIFILLLISFIKQVSSGKITINWMFLSMFSPIIILLIFIIFLKSPLYVAFEENFVAKSISRGSDVTAGRTIIWESIIRNTPFFGSKDISVKQLLGFSAHNSYLSILDSYGWIPAILYTLFWIISFCKSIKQFMGTKQISLQNTFAVTSITLFMSMSMMEVLTHTLAVFVGLSGVAILQINDKELK